MNPRTIQLNSCQVRVWDDTQYLETVFLDGTKVPAAPQDTLQYATFAESLGHSSPWEMTLFHEVLHSLICEAVGLEHSKVMWAVAHGEKWERYMAEEETTIFAFHRYLNGLIDESDPHLQELAKHCNIHALRTKALELLRP